MGTINRHIARPAYRSGVKGAANGKPGRFRPDPFVKLDTQKYAYPNGYQHLHGHARITDVGIGFRILAFHSVNQEKRFSFLSDGALGLYAAFNGSSQRRFP
ncbi:hypothetical protein COLO4_02304 [Corchorus olitorius]|uniref:Uncharacterized protein n=1 Tax=Corchorus olitorius TaxID=93759 RepID=A0A1R3L1C6_9ROSI|nr:hypothetical protein COLO4_02304 [Corchorus olitorius]